MIWRKYITSTVLAMKEMKHEMRDMLLEFVSEVSTSTSTTVSNSTDDAWTRGFDNSRGMWQCHGFFPKVLHLYIFKNFLMRFMNFVVAGHARS